VTKSHYNLFWNSIFVLILLGISSFFYISTKKINYIWRWENVFQYVWHVYDKEIKSPFDGTAIIQEKKLILISDTGEKEVIDNYSKLTVSNNDLVFEGDVVATIKTSEPGPLLLGLFITLKLSIFSIILAIILGILTGLMRISKNPALKKLAITYIELIRGTPLLVQIFIFYFFIGTVLQLDRFTSGVAALGVFAGAYVAEIVRAGIQSINKGQTEAAKSLGMNYFQTMRYIILPQALKRTIPPMAGQFISLIKDSSLVSVISITDLTKAGREVVTSTFQPFEVWFTVAALYLIITTTLSFLTQLLERRLAKSE
jgi:polar amino acid transport system permease protein